MALWLARWGLGSSPSWGHCVVFSGVRHFTLTVPDLHLGVYVSFGEFKAGVALDYHLIQGRVEILLVAQCCRNRNKPRQYGPLGRRKLYPYHKDPPFTPFIS